MRSVSSAQGCDQQPSAKQIPIAAPSSGGTGQTPPAMTTSELSPPIGCEGTGSASTQSPAASPAKISATPDLAPDSPEIDPDCGSNMPGSLASWDRTSLSWKTSQRCLIEGWATFSERFPTSGTMQCGTLYRAAPWDLHMCDDECSLWPTPTASMDGRGFGIPLHENTGRYKRSTVLRVHALVKEHGWRIHPNFTEALMDFPSGWSEIEQSETPCRPKSQSQSGAQS